MVDVRNDGVYKVLTHEPLLRYDISVLGFRDITDIESEIFDHQNAKYILSLSSKHQLSNLWDFAFFIGLHRVDADFQQLCPPVENKYVKIIRVAFYTGRFCTGIPFDDTILSQKNSTLELARKSMRWSIQYFFIKNDVQSVRHMENMFKHSKKKLKLYKKTLLQYVFILLLHKNFSDHRSLTLDTQHDGDLQTYFADIQDTVNFQQNKLFNVTLPIIFEEDIETIVNYFVGHFKRSFNHSRATQLIDRAKQSGWVNQNYVYYPVW